MNKELKRISKVAEEIYDVDEAFDKKLKKLMNVRGVLIDISVNQKNMLISYMVNLKSKNNFLIKKGII